MKKLMYIIPLVVFMFFSLPVMAASTNVVTSVDMMGWGFLQETGTTATGGLVEGPLTAPSGNGSAHITLGDSSDGMLLGMLGYGGTMLSDVTQLTYHTYQAPSSTSTVQAISLQFNIDDDITDGDDSWKGRLVFEPYYSETVQKGTWQMWDTMTQGRWWGTGAAINGACSIGSPCTWDEVLSEFPNIGIHNVFGSVHFKAGSGWPAGFDGNVDALTIGIGEESTTYDFEPIVRSAMITSPEANEDVMGMVNLSAYLMDDDVDAIQWAVRQGTCAAGTNTVFGNVDGHSDLATMDTSDPLMQTFSFDADMTGQEPGMYCFIYNPVEDSGESNIRKTVEFNLVLPMPEDKNDCKNGGWMNLADSEGNTFKNQGQCVSYTVRSEKSFK